MVYQRSKDEGGVRPFGSLEKMYENDFVWLNHSITPSNINEVVILEQKLVRVINLI